MPLIVIIKNVFVFLLWEAALHQGQQSVYNEVMYELCEAIK